MTILTPPPPSILGGTIPHPGLAATSLGDMTLNGWHGLSTNLGPALTDANIDFKLDGTSTLALTVEDDHATLLRSKLAQWKSWVIIDGVGFVFSAFRKQGKALTFTFDHEIVADLNNFTDPMAVAAGTTTRTGFARKLASSAPWVQVQTPAGESPGVVQSALSVGNVDPTTGLPAAPTISTVAQAPETYYEAIGRVLDEIGWRRFPRGHDQLFLVPDAWLFNQPPVYVLDESSQGVDDIDFEWDSRQPIANLTLYCRAETWAYPVGSVVKLTDQMGIAAGNWLVSEINRSLLSSSAVVSLQSPQPTIPEPTASATPSAAASVSSAEAAASSVSFAIQQIGKPYVWGGASSSGFDCSGLTQAAYSSAGISIPRTAQGQFDAGPPVTGDPSVGDLVFFGSSAANIQHVGIYIGDGKMIDAPHSGASVRQESFTPVVGAAWGSEKYQGATHPAANAPTTLSANPSISSAQLGGVASPPGSAEKANQALGQKMAADVGWTGTQWVALNNVVMAESGWKVTAQNPKSPAYGIPQADPPEKMASAGVDWRTNATTQITWLLSYIKTRYTTPMNAWQYHLKHGSY